MSSNREPKATVRDREIQVPDVHEAFAGCLSKLDEVFAGWSSKVDEILGWCVSHGMTKAWATRHRHEIEQRLEAGKRQVGECLEAGKREIEAKAIEPAKLQTRRRLLQQKEMNVKIGALTAWMVEEGIAPPPHLTLAPMRPHMEPGAEWTVAGPRGGARRRKAVPDLRASGRRDQPAARAEPKPPVVPPPPQQAVPPQHAVPSRQAVAARGAKAALAARRANNAKAKQTKAPAATTAGAKRRGGPPGGMSPETR